MQDLISVIMSVHNAESTLPEAVESVLGQTYSNIQFIICDDASTDGSYALLQQYAWKDNRIVLIQNEKNSKLSFSLNHCLQYATGEYVARMDADDISTSDRFEKQLAFLKEHPEFQVVGTSMQRFSDKGMADIVKAVENPDRFTLRRAIPYCHATILMRKSAYDALGGYTVSERTVRGQDVDLWYRFYSLGFEGYNLMDPLYFVREDMAAIKRRTAKVRWNAYKTTRMGFKLLNYPRHWIIFPTVKMILNIIMPAQMMLLYRKLQNMIYHTRK